MRTNSTLDDDALLDRLVDESRLLSEAWARCDPAAAVPGLEWDARTVVAHTGAVHRWATDVVARRLAVDELGGSAAFPPSTADAGRLGAWFDEGAAALVEVLAAAPAGLDCFTLIPGAAPRTFWIRRQAHETAIHRADVQAAAGVPVSPVDAAFAQDGLGEIVGAFATESAFAADRPGRLLLDASDGPGWLIVFGGERNVVTSDGAATADAVVRATSAELYLWAWNRPAPVALTGDPRIVDLWRTVRVR